MAARDGFHETFERDVPEGGSDRSFGVVFAVVFALFAAFRLGEDPIASGVLFAIAAAFLGLAFLAPSRLAPLNRAWTRFGLLLGRIVTPVVMAAVWALTIVPIGLVLRLVGHDPLRLRPDPEAPTYWIERTPPGPDPATMRNQF